MSVEHQRDADAASGADEEARDRFLPRDDLDDDRGGPCIGANCCCPHPDHRRDECVTVEMTVCLACSNRAWSDR